MVLLSTLPLLLLASCAPGSALQFSAPSRGAALQPAEERVHLIAQRFSDIDGNIHQLGMRSAAAPVALVFLDPTSPAASSSLPAMRSLAMQAASLDMEFFGVVSNGAVSVTQVRAYREQHKPGFPLLFDASGELASLLQPTHMPQGFLVTRRDALAYRGPLQGEAHNLGLAIEALANGRPVPGDWNASPSTADAGERFQEWPSNLNEIELTYNRNIAPILEASCIDCHRPDDAAPFALDNYKSVKRRARMILFACEDGIMPPWQAHPGVNLFREQRSVSDRQIEIIRAWAKAECPEGDPEDLLQRREQHQGGWRLGEPDMILTLPPFDLPAEGADVFQNFVIPSGFLEGRLVVGVEFRPKAKSVLHHMGLFVDSSGDARASDLADPGVGFSSFGPGVAAGEEGESLRGFDFPMVRGWVPGQEPFITPKGLGVPLEPGCDFVISTHYHLDGTAVTDQSEIALYFGDPEHTRNLFLGTILTNKIAIPAGEKSYKRHVLANLPVSSTFLNITPHMHNLGASVDVWATPPGGERMHLLRIDNWDYRWQNTYTFSEPIFLPKGTLLESIHFFDNSAENPNNPSIPPKDVSVGWYTEDEMCMLYFNFVPEKNPRKQRAFFINVETTLKTD